MNGWNDTDEYSTSEVKTNKVWIDGKPIYRKTFYDSNNGISNTTHLDVPYIDAIITYSTGQRNGISGAYFPITYSITNRGLSNAYLTSSDAFGQVTSITFEYIKTSS